MPSQTIGLTSEELCLKGVAVSSGIAIGELLLRFSSHLCPEKFPITKDAVEQELERFQKALEITEQQIEALQERTRTVSGEKNASIFDAHILFLKDSMMLSQVRKGVEESLLNVEYVFYNTVQRYLLVMQSLGDDYLRNRGIDLEDVRSRVLHNMHLQQEDELAKAYYASSHILVANDLNPSDTAAMDVDHVLGFVTEQGSAMSHTAILARSMGIPAIVGMEDAMQRITDMHARCAILDGYEGVLIINPSQETISKYKRIQMEKKRAYRALEKMKNLPTVTLDGHHVCLALNVEFPHEHEGMREVGAEGIGLFRTEFFLLGDGEHPMPGEDEQTRRYEELVTGCAPYEVVFRTLDAGGDKLPMEKSDPEPNPFLGWRGIRVSLSCREMFKTQLKAILRASAKGAASVMFPMVSGRTEVILAKTILQECRDELDAAGIPYGKDLKVGIMVEVPSAAMLADVLAQEVDFFSIGTNDLTQYAIAVDRINSRVAHMFRPTHPGVVRMMDMTIRAGKKHGIPTTICGEVAGDILLLPLIVGLGARELSVGGHLVPILRYAIRSLNYEECKRIAQEALMAPDSHTVFKLSSELARKSYPILFE